MGAKLAVLALVPVVLVGGVVMNASILIVEVQDDDVDILVPVPLALAQIAVAFAPDEVKRIDCPEIAPYIPHLGRVFVELREAPDGILVLVEEGDERVSVAKDGDSLVVDVFDGREEEVHVRLPLEAVDGLLRSYDADGEFFRTSKMVAALRASPSGELVHVLDGDEEVRIRMW